MNVLVIGAGIADLTSAIALRSAGHKVTLLERASKPTSSGTGIGIPPCAGKVLEYLHVNLERARATIGRSGRMLKGDKMQEIMFVDELKDRDIFGGTPQRYAYRMDLQDELLHLALTDDPPTSDTWRNAGPPVELISNSKVIEYKSEAGSVILADGRTLISDLVIAADGVHSIAPKYVLGYDCPAQSSGTTVTRFVLPTAVIKSDPKLNGIIRQPGEFTFYVGPDGGRRWLLQYPLQNDGLQNFAMYSQMTDLAEVDAQVRRFQCDRDSLRRELDGFHEAVVALAGKTSDILPIWKVEDRKPLPTWHKNILLMIGDAAHPMCPHRGFGGAMAIEDAGALAIIFRNMQSTNIKEISQRLELFETVRLGRASVVQLVSSKPYWVESVKSQWDELTKYFKPDDLPQSTNDIRYWVMGYDVLKDSQRYCERNLQV